MLNPPDGPDALFRAAPGHVRRPRAVAFAEPPSRDIKESGDPRRGRRKAARTPARGVFERRFASDHSPPVSRSRGGKTSNPSTGRSFARIADATNDRIAGIAGVVQINKASDVKSPPVTLLKKTGDAMPIDIAAIVSPGLSKGDTVFIYEFESGPALIRDSGEIVKREPGRGGVICEATVPLIVCASLAVRAVTRATRAFAQELRIQLRQRNLSTRLNPSPFLPK